MNRKDYLKLALAISSAKPITGDLSFIASDTHRKVAEKIAEVLAEDNPRFDKLKFLRACGVEI